MTLTFILKNKKFEDTLAVSVGEETKILSDECTEVTFETETVTQADVNVRYIEKGSEENTTLVLKIILSILFLPLIILIPIINFFVENDGGIKIDGFFKSENPFKIKKTFKLALNEDNKYIPIEFVSAKYVKHRKSYSKPDILFHDTEITETTEEVFYDKKSMKLSFILFHIPAYVVALLFIVAITTLITAITITKFSTLGTLGLLGLTFCFAVMIFLFVAMITFVVKTFKLYKQVDHNLAEEFSKK